MYYDMLPKDFEAMYLGYTRKLNNQSAELRRATFINILPHVQKLTFQNFCRDFWPLETDRPEEKRIDRVVSKEMFEKIMQARTKKLQESRRIKNNVNP